MYLISNREVGDLVFKYNHSQISAYIYATHGATVEAVKTNVEENFLPTVGQKPSTARWTNKDSLFSMLQSLIQSNLSVTWIGVNDVNRGLDIDAQLDLFLEAQEKLYSAGARNFIFFNVPPFHRSPIGCIPIFCSVLMTRRTQ